jgi:hypothetical protein
MWYGVRGSHFLQQGNPPEGDKVRVHPIPLALRYLKGQKTIRDAPYYGNSLFGSTAEAAAALRRFTGQDFGTDARLWGEWLRKNRWVYYGARN